MPEPSPSLPTLCLAMIVRDESTIIERCLNSVLPFIDHWLIFDTGSIDGTPDIIERCLSDLPGRLIRQPFSNFSLLRSTLFQLAEKEADYVLMMDADEELLCLGNRLLPRNQFDAARLEIQQAEYTLRQHRVFRSGMEFNYRGSVHERTKLSPTVTQINLDTARIKHHKDGYRARQSFTLPNDISYLLQDLKNEDNSSVRLALAASYLQAKEEDNARKQLQAVIDNHQAPSRDRWMAHYMTGLQLTSSDSQERALESFLNAYEMDPSRAEALYRMAEILGQQQRWEDAQQLTRLVIETEKPDADYYEPDIYDWGRYLLHASFCIELEQFDDAHHALQSVPRRRLSSSAGSYLKQLLEKPGMHTIFKGSEIPKPDRLKRPKLSIGMATYDDYDGVYFTIASLLSAHPEVRDKIEIIILDNHPSGTATPALKKLAAQIDLVRYQANDEIQGTAIRTHLFDHARGEIVLCIDCHIVILPGGLQELINYFDSHPDSTDLIQGPLVNDNLDRVKSHMEPRWHAGLFGRWPRNNGNSNIPDKPFEIQVQGLGLYACKHDAWPGYNPRFAGFGGEEGYIHEKFRQRGGRVICLPSLRWMHRFERPMGAAPYNSQWDQLIRNYLIGYDELGLDTGEMEAHFTELLGFEAMARARAAFKLEQQNPFYFFDAIYCINLDKHPEKWEKVQAQAEKLGFAHRLRRFSAIETPDNSHIGCSLSHRAIIKIAKTQKFSRLLVLEDDVIFCENTLSLLQARIKELTPKTWDLFYLGAYAWDYDYPMSPDCMGLSEVGLNTSKTRGPTCLHAIAYHQHGLDRLLEILPDSLETMQNYEPASQRAVDQIFAHDAQLKRFISTPHIASQPPILRYESSDFRPLLPE